MTKLELIKKIKFATKSAMSSRGYIEKHKDIRISHNFTNATITGNDLLQTIDMLVTSFYNKADSTIDKKWNKDKLIKVYATLRDLEKSLLKLSDTVCDMKNNINQNNHTIINNDTQVLHNNNIYDIFKISQVKNNLGNAFKIYEFTNCHLIDMYLVYSLDTNSYYTCIPYGNGIKNLHDVVTVLNDSKC